MNGPHDAIRARSRILGSAAVVIAAIAALVRVGQTCNAWSLWVVAPAAVVAPVMLATRRSPWIVVLAVILTCVLMYVAATAVFGAWCSR